MWIRAQRPEGGSAFINLNASEAFHREIKTIRIFQPAEEFSIFCESEAHAEKVMAALLKLIKPTNIEALQGKI